MDTKDISAIIEQAKQRRAEYIGSSIRNHPVIALLVVAIPVLLMQVHWTPTAPVANDLQGARVAEFAPA